MKIIKLQDELREAVGKPKREIEGFSINPALLSTISADYGQKMAEALESADRQARQAALGVIEKEAKEKLKETYADAEIGNAIEEIFLQIEGQLEKVVKVLGGHDVYIDDYATLEAPANAKLIDDVWVAENEAVTNAWIARLAPGSQEVVKQSFGSKWDEVNKERKLNA